MVAFNIPVIVLLLENTQRLLENLLIYIKHGMAFLLLLIFASKCRYHPVDELFICLLFISVCLFDH